MNAKSLIAAMAVMTISVSSASAGVKSTADYANSLCSENKKLSVVNGIEQTVSYKRIDQLGIFDINTFFPMLIPIFDVKTNRLRPNPSNQPSWVADPSPFQDRGMGGVWQFAEIDGKLQYMKDLGEINPTMEATSGERQAPKTHFVNKNDFVSFTKQFFRWYNGFDLGESKDNCHYEVISKGQKKLLFIGKDDDEIDRMKRNNMGSYGTSVKKCSQEKQLLEILRRQISLRLAIASNDSVAQAAKFDNCKSITGFVDTNLEESIRFAWYFWNNNSRFSQKVASAVIKNDSMLINREIMSLPNVQTNTTTIIDSLLYLRDTTRADDATSEKGFRDRTAQAGYKKCQRNTAAHHGNLGLTDQYMVDNQMCGYTSEQIRGGFRPATYGYDNGSDEFTGLTQGQAANLLNQKFQEAHRQEAAPGGAYR